MARLEFFTPELTEVKILNPEERGKILAWIVITRDLVNVARIQISHFGRESPQTSLANWALFRQFMGGDEAAIEAALVKMSLEDQDIAIDEVEQVLVQFAHSVSRLYRRLRQTARN